MNLKLKVWKQKNNKSSGAFETFEVSEISSEMSFLEMFDAPDVCDCYERAWSVRPQQALALTNSELPLPRALRPNAQRTQVPRCSPDALVTRARAQRPKTPFRPLSVEEAPRLYEQLYADEIRFRKTAGR